MIKKIRKTIKRYKDTRDFLRSIRKTDRSLYSGEHIGADRSLVYDAQKLHADVYLSRNFISITDVAEDGRMHKTADPHQDHSTYFVIRSKKTNKILGTSRQILHTHSKSYASFPILEKSHIYEKWQEYIYRHSPDKIVEISGLAKLKDANSIAPLYLYRAMWHHSLQEQHTLWLMACDVRLFQRLKVLLGGTITQIGDETHYQGGNVIPAIVRPKKALHALIKSTIKTRFTQRYLRLLVIEFFVSGLPLGSMRKEDRDQLRRIGVIKTRQNTKELSS